MGNIYLFFLFWCFCLSYGQFFNKNDYLMEKFRKTNLSTSILYSEAKSFKQPVDNFDETDQRFWQQKYYENMKKWRHGGPIYIYIGGERPVSYWSLYSGLLYDLAVETHGAMFAVEHRYYGQSQPFSPVTKNNLKYLSSRQALADLANFIKGIKLMPHFNESKVVVIGGSYPGNLAVWMRVVYPHLVDAAIASSAPVLAKLDFSEYFETVSDDLQKFTTPECFNEITRNFTQYRNVFTTQTGLKELKKEFYICDYSDMSNTENQNLFFTIYFYLAFGLSTQYGNIPSLRQFCEMQRNFIAMHMPNNNIGCYYCDFKVLFNLNSDVYKRELFSYQMCNEFGYFFTSSEKPPFGDILPDVDSWIAVCNGLFGSEFTKANMEAAIKKTNDMYGGQRPNVTNVFFSNGELDPWAKLGVLKDLSDAAPARIIPGATHCNDLSETFNSEVKKVQEEEKKYIKKWIGFNS